MNSLISLEKVNYQIADQHILHDVDWQIPAGAHITLTGPSGGGKSTLLRIIAAMISKTSGTLILMGSRLKAMTQSCIGGKSHIVSNNRRYLVRRWQIT
nr:ATP-binding cassette domain-containing protein [Lactiplantibacillus plantarum]